MSDKIAEIRARHEEGIRAGADEDRAYLLAEVERLRAFNINAARETLEAVGEAADDAREEMRAKVVRLTRERDEAWSKETDYGEGFEEGWAAAQKHAAAEVERLQGLLEDISRDMVEAVVRLTHERDEARAEVERLRNGRQCFMCGRIVREIQEGGQ